MSRREGLSLLAEYAWDTSDVARKEMTRYQSGAGQASAYMIGQLVIERLRNYAERSLKGNFNLKEFHYQVDGFGYLFYRIFSPPLSRKHVCASAS